MSTVRERVVVFDGFCNLCSGWAHFLGSHPVEPPFRLIPMQSEEGRQLLRSENIDPNDPSTFLVLDEGRVFLESDGVLHIMHSLGGIWRLLAAAKIIPSGVRDILYRMIARNRYRLFGRRATCYLPGGPAE